mgnify:CR=1 FL=1
MRILRWLTMAMMPIIGVGVALAQGQPATTLDAQPVVSDKNAGNEPEAFNPTLPTLFLVGDSTLKSSAPLRGWASEVGIFLDQKKINVVNRAIGGRSSKTFMLEGRWKKVMDELKPGDFVVVQFGHNDRFMFDDPAAKGRPSLHGTGEETGQLKKAGTIETIHTFGWYLRTYVAEAQSKGATPILVSMVPHKIWNKDGTIQRPERERHVMWTRDSATRSKAIFINLNEIAALEMEKIGPGPAADGLFADKGTHTSVEGARFNARSFISGMNALPNNPLREYLNPEGRAIKPANKAFAVAPASTERKSK